MSSDWASDPTAVPYATYTNPQNLNLYNHMRNNPLSGADPDGHSGEGDLHRTASEFNELENEVEAAEDQLNSRPIGNGRQTVYESFGPFKDSISSRQTYIYNNPGH